MELRECLRVIGRNWIVIAVTILVALVTGYFVATTMPPTYTAESKVMVEASGGTGTAQEHVAGNTLVLQQIGTYAQLATTPLVLQPTIDSLALDTTPELLAEDVSASIVDETAVLSITASTDSASGAAEIADTIAATLIEVIAAHPALVPPPTPPVDATGAPIETIVVPPTTLMGSIAQDAAPPDKPTSPDLLLIMIVALGAGVALAFIIVVLREVLNSRIRNVRDLAKAVEVPIIGGVPTVRGLRRNPLAARSAPDGRLAEALRLIRARLTSSLTGSTPVIAVTSPSTGEGKTAIAANLAIVLAEEGRRVVLVDAHVRAPALAEIFGVDVEGGLLDVLRGQTAAKDVTIAMPLPNLAVVPTGAVAPDGTTPAGTSPNGTALFDPRSIRALVDFVKKDADVVVIDAGAAGAVADASDLAEVADGFILVARARRTSIRGLHRAIENLNESDGTIVGVILDDVPASGPDAG